MSIAKRTGAAVAVTFGVAVAGIAGGTIGMHAYPKLAGLPPVDYSHRHMAWSEVSVEKRAQFVGDCTAIFSAGAAGFAAASLLNRRKKAPSPN
jgi:hypothetical protein